MDKHTGFIPRAYAQAFDFDVNIEEDGESNDEMSKLAKGMAIVKLSKHTSGLRTSLSEFLVDQQ